MKRLQKLAKVTEYLTQFRLPDFPDIVPIMTVNQENATSQLNRVSGEQLLVAMPEGRCTGQDSDSFENSVSFAVFALSKVNGPARTPETAAAAYAQLLRILDLYMALETDMRYASTPRLALENAGVKLIEKRIDGEAGSEYRRSREQFISLIHTWFAQITLLTEDVPPEMMPNAEILPDPERVRQLFTPERARRMLDAAENLLAALHTNVNDELALRTFCLSINLLLHKAPGRMNRNS